MKQVLQNLKSGSTELVNVPSPLISNGRLLIRSTTSLISAGTERMLIEFSKAGLLDKARQQPEKVAMAVDKIRTDGFLPTFQTIQGRLDQSIPMGYCNVGRIIDIGSNVTGFEVGDRIVSNGPHAEIVNVPVNLCAKIPDSVDDESAAFVVVGAIALQSIRLIKPTMGEAIAVFGLGLVGLITVQLLRANGCRVLGIDYDANRLALAKSYGAEVVNLSLGEDPLRSAEKFSRSYGMDGVIVATSTNSNDPIHQAAIMLRKRGRIVLVGVAGLELVRDDFFKKELTFQVSASYGPGRYDPLYEDKGHDYPIGFVRWTEQRNFEAILDMLSDGKLNFKGLISHQFSLKDVAAAYELLSNKKESIGVLLKYQESGSNQKLKDKTIYLNRSPNSSEVKSKARIAVIGSGSYALSTLIPALKNADVNMSIIASRSGIGARHAGFKFSFNEVTTDVDSLFNREDIDAVVIATRHDSHAELVLKSLRAKKHVFVEKPLCLSQEELSEIQDQYSLLAQSTLPCPILMVGFNRRFSPQIQRIKSLLEASSDLKSFVITVNSGFIPKDHWTQDLAVGGGRIIGELCHFIDLLQFLSGSQIKNFDSISMDSINKDTITAHFKFSNGSIGVINYLSNGNRRFPKERIEIFFGGRILCLDNFRKLNGYGFKDFKSMNLWRQDKGHNACISAFINAIHNPSRPPIPVNDLFSTSQISIELSTQN